MNNSDNNSNALRFTPDNKQLVQLPYQCESIMRDSYRKFVLIVCFVFVSFFAWSSTTKLDAVIRGSGSIVPTHQNQLVQHFEGGIISKILVEEGQIVKKDDILMHITDSVSKSEMQQVSLDLSALRLRLVRLKAEAQGREKIVFPEELNVESFTDLVVNEKKLFKRRKQELVERVRILEDQTRQRELEISEKKSRLKNITEELRLAQKRVDNLKRLNGLGAVSQNELLSNQSSLQRLKTTVGDLEHQIPQAESGLSEMLRRRNEEILRFRSEAEEEAIETRVRIAKLEETVNAMQDRKRRSDIRAPMSGTVNKIFVPTIGGVVRPGQPVVEIVPQDNSVIVEVRLSPKDRDEVWPGQAGVVKVSAYDFSIYGGLKGEVIDVSPDAFRDESGEAYFRVRIKASGSFGRGNPVVPGMLAEVDILTSEHTILSYLLKPISQIREKALRQ